MHPLSSRSFTGHEPLLNFNPHIILAKPPYPNARPDWLMIRHSFLQIPKDRLQGLIDWHKKRVYSNDLLPAFPSSMLQVEVYRGETLVDW